MPSRSGWLHRIRRCTRVEFALLVEAQLYLAISELIRLARPVGGLFRGAPGSAAKGGVPPSGEEAGLQLRTAALVGWAVARAAKHGIIRSKCLVRSLAIQRMLRRRGIYESELRIGVRVEEGKLLAHAWVELHGAVVGDSVGYVRTFQSAPDLSLVQL